MDNESRVRIKYLRFMSLYALLMLFAVIAFISTNKKSPQDTEPPSQATEATDTLSEYAYVTPDNTPITESSAETEDIVYTVKSYMGKIGIFTPDGKLFDLLEVYVKTLPEADIRLLEEGFEVVGRSQLNSIIEDYTE